MDAPTQDDGPANEYDHHGGADRGRPESGEQGVGHDDDGDDPSGPATGNADEAEGEPDEPGQQHEVLAGDYQHVDDAGTHECVPLGALERAAVAEQKCAGDVRLLRGQVLGQGRRAAPSRRGERAGVSPGGRVPTRDRGTIAADTEFAAQPLVAESVVGVALAGIAGRARSAPLADELHRVAGLQAQHRRRRFHRRRVFDQEANAPGGRPPRSRTAFQCGYLQHGGVEVVPALGHHRVGEVAVPGDRIVDEDASHAGEALVGADVLADIVVGELVDVGMVLSQAQPGERQPEQANRVGMPDELPREYAYEGDTQTEDDGTADVAVEEDTASGGEGDGDERGGREFFPRGRAGRGREDFSGGRHRPASWVVGNR